MTKGELVKALDGIDDNTIVKSFTNAGEPRGDVSIGFIGSIEEIKEILVVLD